MNQTKYTVAICNYNMADTLEESLRSILDQLEGDERFEVLVIDDGSTDGSQKILDKLEKEYKILRWTEGNNKNLAEARNQSFDCANGQTVVFQIDTDDKFYPIIKDFIEIYEQISQQLDEEFLLDTQGIDVAPKKLLLDTPHRSLGYGEDRDLWRRLKIKDQVVTIPSSYVARTIGYDRGKLGKIQNALERTVVTFRSGVRIRDYYKTLLQKENFVFQDYLRLMFAPLLFLIAYKRGIYGLKGDYAEHKEISKFEGETTLSGQEEEHSFEINWDRISGHGESVFKYCTD